MALERSGAEVYILGRRLDVLEKAAKTKSVCQSENTSIRRVCETALLVTDVIVQSSDLTLIILEIR